MEREYDAGLQGRIDFGENYSEVINMQFKDQLYNILQIFLNLVMDYGLISLRTHTNDMLDRFWESGCCMSLIYTGFLSNYYSDG